MLKPIMNSETRHGSGDPFSIRRGSHGVEESVAEGDYYAPKNRDADHLYEGDVVGEAARAPSFSRAHDGFFDDTSRMELKGRQGRHDYDFTVADADDRKNLKVVLNRDFEGDGRLVISNEGRLGGDAEVEFALGDLSRGPSNMLLQPEEAGPWWNTGIDKVEIHKARDSCRIDVQAQAGTAHYLIRDGQLFQEI